MHYRFISEKYNEGIINLKYCATNMQIADVFTKPLKFVNFEKCRNSMLKSLNGD